MPQCECLPRCPFFNDQMPDSSGLGAIDKRRYCLDNFKDCARQAVFEKLGSGAVPATLYPNMFARAQQILSSG